MQLWWPRIGLNFSMGPFIEGLFNTGESEQPHNSLSRQFLKKSTEFSLTVFYWWIIHGILNYGLAYWNKNTSFSSLTAKRLLSSIGLKMTSYKNSEPTPPIMLGSSTPKEWRVPLIDWDRPPWNRWAFQNIRQILPTANIRHNKDRGFNS